MICLYIDRININNTCQIKVGLVRFDVLIDVKYIFIGHFNTKLVIFPGSAF